MEKLEEFDRFVSDGIEYILSKRGRTSQDAEDSSSISDGNTLARLKDVQAQVARMIDQLRTGLRDHSDIFSTNAEDYIGRE